MLFPNSSSNHQKIADYYLRNPEKGILAQQAQKREQKRLARIAQQQQAFSQPIQNIPEMQTPQIKIGNRLDEFTEMAGNMAEQMPYGKVVLGTSIPAALYGANALMSGGNERWDRTAENTVGNLAGAAGGAALGGRVFGLPGAVAGGLIGGLAGGYASDRIADTFDPTMGMNSEALALQAEAKKQAAVELLNQYLDPRSQAALQQRLMQHQMAVAQG